MPLVSCRGKMFLEILFVLSLVSVGFIGFFLGCFWFETVAVLP